MRIDERTTSPPLTERQSPAQIWRLDCTVSSIAQAQWKGLPLLGELITELPRERCGMVAARGLVVRERGVALCSTGSRCEPLGVCGIGGAMIDLIDGDVCRHWLRVPR